MPEVSRFGLINEEEGEDDEIQLTLELSIGGRTYRKKPMDLTCDASIINTDKGGLITSGADLSNGGAGALMACLDHEKKREIQALRRQEAKKKREEKMKKLDLCGEMSSGFSAKNGLLESQQSMNNVREKRENYKDAFPYEKMKKMKWEREYVNLNKLAYNPSSVLVNPCGNSGEEGQNGKNVLQSAVNYRSFKQYEGNQTTIRNLSTCYDSEYGSSLNGSLGRSYSSLSDYESTSHKGGSSSSDTRSRGNYSQPALQPNASATIDPPEQFQWSGSSNLLESDQFISNNRKLIDAKASELQSKSNAQLDQVNKPISTTRSTLSASLMAETKAVLGKPPKPQTQNHDIQCLQQMPCVSTTGNGPNGKTITGFLYRYTNTEVSIVCVCHGSSFSPAEFVEHAGGIDVAHPLRHITMVPSALG